MSACIRGGKRAKVILSQITDVYKNLALENWILNNWNFTKFNCLLVYQNTPCVVIGRFQNTWREVDVPLASQAGYFSDWENILFFECKKIFLDKFQWNKISIHAIAVLDYLKWFKPMRNVRLYWQWMTKPESINQSIKTTFQLEILLFIKILLITKCAVRHYNRSHEVLRTGGLNLFS